MYLIYDVAKYFDCIEPLENKKILDFGCNHANFLRFGFSGDYTGIDVDKNIIEQNKKEFPQYNFIHYNAHNNQYNISNKSTTIPLQEKYDLICAFSVFTHTCFNEYQSTVKNLKTHLSNNGKILTTFIDISDKENIEKLFEYRAELFKNIDTKEFFEKIENFYTVTIAIKMFDKSTKIYYNTINIPDYNTPTYFITLYRSNWLEKQFKGNVVDVTYMFNDIRSAQKCLVIT